jgi:hypothetical protein
LLVAMSTLSPLFAIINVPGNEPPAVTALLKQKVKQTQKMGISWRSPALKTIGRDNGVLDVKVNVD